MNCHRYRKTVEPKCQDQPGCRWKISVGCLSETSSEFSESEPATQAKPSRKRSTGTVSGFTQRVNQLVNRPEFFRNPDPEIQPHYQDVGGGGDCQFRVFSNMLYGNPGRHAEVRTKIIEQIRKNGPCYPEWWAQSEMEEQGIPMSGNSWIETYCQAKARPAVKGDTRAWGDHLSIQAFTDVYGYAIIMLSKSGNFSIFQPRVLNDEGIPCPPASREITEIINQAIDPINGDFTDLSRFRLLLWQDNIHYTTVSPYNLQPTELLVDSIRDITTGKDGNRPTTATYQMIMSLIPEQEQEIDDIPPEDLSKKEKLRDDTESQDSSGSTSSEDLKEMRKQKVQELEEIDLKISGEGSSSPDEVEKLFATHEELRQDIYNLDQIILEIDGENIQEKDQVNKPIDIPVPEQQYLFNLSNFQEEADTPSDSSTGSDIDLSDQPVNCSDCDNNTKYRGFKAKRQCCKMTAPYKDSCQWNKKKDKCLSK